MKSMYSQISRFWKTQSDEYIRVMRSRAIEWRKAESIMRIERPTRLDRARRLGYKAKKGFVLARVRIRKGGRRKQRPTSGRRQKRMGVSKFSPALSAKSIAESRVAKKFPNLEVVNSYWVWEDGSHRWYEVIMRDPALSQSRA